MLGLADHLGIDRFDLVGHSLGCRIGLVVAGEHPERVRSLVLSDAGPEFPQEAIEFANNVVSSAGGAVRGFAHRGRGDAPTTRGCTPSGGRSSATSTCKHQLRRNWAGKLVFRADPDLFWLLGSAGREDDGLCWEMTARLTMPTLILWGRRSPFFSEDIANRMLEKMADGRLERTDTGHYIPREEPEEFLRIVRGFLAGIE